MAQALDKTYATVQQTGAGDLDLATARIIILSDQHKGARNGADDFRDTEPFTMQRLNIISTVTTR